jgi:hypothetical protein
MSEKPNSNTSIRANTGEPNLPPLHAQCQNLKRRNQARKDLKAVLQNYLETLARPQDVNLNTSAEMWGAYAIELFDSDAESYLATTPVDIDMLFGPTPGSLVGGRTLSAVRSTLTGIKVRRPKHWPDSQSFPRAAGDAEDRRVLRKLTLAFSRDYSFGWLLDEEWFWQEIVGTILDRTRYWLELSLSARLTTPSNTPSFVRSPQPPTEFELAAKLAPPYPKELFNEGGSYRVVHGPEEHKQANAAGWTDAPEVGKRYWVWTAVVLDPEHAILPLPRPAGPEAVPIANPPGKFILGANAIAKQPVDRGDKGNPKLLKKSDGTFYQTVDFPTAERYAGISSRRRQQLITTSVLNVMGMGKNRRVTVESLLTYCPPAESAK